MDFFKWILPVLEYTPDPNDCIEYKQEDGDTVKSSNITKLIYNDNTSR